MVSAPWPFATPTARTRPGSAIETATFILLNLVGLAAYLHPFIFSGTTQVESNWYAHRADGPILVAGVAALCMVLVLASVTSGRMSTRSLAAVGVLAALAGALRTITLPAGANLYFFLVILGAYAFGPRLGFLLGALSFFLSAVVTAGFGPWLPFQVFAAAWMGMTAGWLRPVVMCAGLGRRMEVAAVVAFGVSWGLLFGAITNLWFWPFWVGGPDISFEPGIGLAETLRRYWNYYLLTSLGWDLVRSVCNAVVIAIVGGPLLRALLRFHDRFHWEE